MTNDLINKDQVPAFYDPEDMEGSGLQEDAIQHIYPSFVKIVQSQSRSPYKEQCEVGDAVLTGSLTKLCDKDGYFIFTPIYQLVVYKFQTKESIPQLLDSTTNRRDELARTVEQVLKTDAKQTFTDDRVPGKQCIYVKELRFLILIHDNPAGPLPCILNFQKGSYAQGSAFLGMLLGKVKLFTRNFACTVRAKYDQDGNEYWVPAIQNPPGDCGYGPRVTDEVWYRNAKSLHEQYASDASSLSEAPAEETESYEEDTGEFN